MLLGAQHRRDQARPTGTVHKTQGICKPRCTETRRIADGRGFVPGSKSAAQTVRLWRLLHEKFFWSRRIDYGGQEFLVRNKAVIRDPHIQHQGVGCVRGSSALAEVCFVLRFLSSTGGLNQWSRAGAGLTSQPVTGSKEACRCRS